MSGKSFENVSKSVILFLFAETLLRTTISYEEKSKCYLEILLFNSPTSLFLI